MLLYLDFFVYILCMHIRATMVPDNIQNNKWKRICKESRDNLWTSTYFYHSVYWSTQVYILQGIDRSLLQHVSILHYIIITNNYLWLRSLASWRFVEYIHSCDQRFLCRRVLSTYPSRELLDNLLCQHNIINNGHIILSTCSWCLACTHPLSSSCDHQRYKQILQ